MQTIKLIQGTPEWHAHRAQHFNASDAPAMLGCSPYQTRSELLARMHTGLSAEVDAATQRRFDDGHRFEALARPLAEKIIGEDLYAVTGVNGKFSASFDGLTMLEEVAFEHKTINDDLRAVMVDGCTGADLPKHYCVQMEHQALVSGCERVLFMASKWDGDELVEERHCWYEPDGFLRTEIVQGWAQFEHDLAAYVPAPAAAPAPTGKAPETLPALRIEVTGAVTASNLAEFKQTALAVFGGINRTLTTDADFANAEQTVKWCGDVEDRLAAAKQHALSQTASIDDLFRTIDDISAEARRVRLELDKLVKARKEAIRGEVVADGIAKLREHITGLNERIGKPLMPTIPADFGGIIKGKRTIDSLRDAVATELARAKIAANEVADRIQVNLRALQQHQALAFLFADVAQIVLKDSEDLRALVENRIAQHKDAEARKEDETRERIRKEEEERAQKQAQAVIASAQTTAPAPVAATPVVSQPAAPTPVASQKQANVEDNGARIKLGEINARIAPLNITADGLAELGFPHVATDKAAKLYRESDYHRICEALIQHITHAAELQAA